LFAFFARPGFGAILEYLRAPDRGHAADKIGAPAKSLLKAN